MRRCSTTRRSRALKSAAMPRRWPRRAAVRVASTTSVAAGPKTVSTARGTAAVARAGACIAWAMRFVAARRCVVAPVEVEDRDGTCVPRRHRMLGGPRSQSRRQLGHRSIEAARRPEVHGLGDWHVEVATEDQVGGVPSRDHQLVVNDSGRLAHVRPR